VCNEKGEFIEKMKKSRFIWILKDEKDRVSTDRLSRFIPRKKEITVPRVISMEPFYKDTSLTHGDFVIFKHSLNTYLAVVGQIINFHKETDTNGEPIKTKKGRKFSFSFCILNDKNKNVHLTLSPCYSIQNTGGLIMYQNSVYSVKRYVNSVNPNILNFHNMSIGRNNARKLSELIK
jgi:hypothetical protein